MELCAGVWFDSEHPPTQLHCSMYMGNVKRSVCLLLSRLMVADVIDRYRGRWCCLAYFLTTVKLFTLNVDSGFPIPTIFFRFDFSHGFMSPVKKSTINSCLCFSLSPFSSLSHCRCFCSIFFTLHTNTASHSLPLFDCFIVSYRDHKRSFLWKRNFMVVVEENHTVKYTSTRTHTHSCWRTREKANRLHWRMAVGSLVSCIHFAIEKWCERYQLPMLVPVGTTTKIEF